MQRIIVITRRWMVLIGAGIASFLAALAAMSATDPPTHDELSLKRVPRVAVIFNGTNETHRPLLQAFAGGMHQLGYTNGREVVLDVRWANAQPHRLPEIISDLLDRKPDVLVVAGSQAAWAARNATKSIPIVMASVADPVSQGLVVSLARPGGNITGIAIPSEGPIAKIVEHLHELVPSASRIAVLINPTNPVHAISWKQAQLIAKERRVQLTRFEASGLGELELALAAMAKERPHALVVSADMLFNSFHRRIARFAADKRIPTGYFSRDAVTGGGLMSYSPSIAEHYFLSARYVHHILNGMKPHELPIEQPMQFELTVNVRTARALGITLPQAVVSSAGELID